MDTERCDKISVVVPTFRSEAFLHETHRRLTEALSSIDGCDYEIVYVNDGSPDRAGEIVKGFVSGDHRVRLVSFSRNFGHQAAITAGLDHAVGDAVVIIDDDLQDPPEVIGEMVDCWRKGNQVVYGQRIVRRGESVFKRVTAKMFYRVLSVLSERPLPLDAGDFRLLDRSVVDVLKAMREESRYMRGMVSWVGFKQCPLKYEREPRYSGESVYGVRQSIRLALNGIVSFSTRPLALSSALGALVTVGACILGIWLVVEKIVSPAVAPRGTTLILLVVLFMGGVQLMTIGILGTYLGKVLTETKRRPLYVAAERVGFPNPTESEAGGSMSGSQDAGVENDSPGTGPQ